MADEVTHDSPAAKLHESEIRRHYTLVCQCDYADDHDFDERIATSTECVMHGDEPDPLFSLLAEYERLRQALRTLRDAWNAHMETCSQHAALPDLPAPTEDELRAWRDAPSNTASAFIPEGDQRCGYVMDACRCMKRKGHDGLHACAHGGWNDVGAKYPPKAAHGDLIDDPNFDPKGDDELSV